VYPAIADTANALLLCRDPFNGLQCYAAEDDAVQPTQGAQGASTVYLALRRAVGAAEALGIEPDPRWTQRAEELRAATLQRLCDENGCGGGRGGIYLVWPSRLLQPSTPLTQRQLAPYADQLDAWSSFAAPPIDGFFQYPMEALLALAPAWDDPARATKLDGWARWLTHDVAEPGVLHYGERIFRSGPRSYLHSVGFPHIWSGTEMYIAAAFIYGLTGCPAGSRIGEALCRG
jgi:GH15 family glucan-1,4-alpha-glucosidase